MCDEQFMQRAVQKAREAIAAGQTPFGAVVGRDGQVIAEAHNTVWQDGDPTAHAEMNAIRRAAAALHSIDLSGCTMWTTCEPCPMCLAAIHWSRIGRVVYGASIADAVAAGFGELRIGARDLAALGGSSLAVQPGPLSRECRQLFQLWQRAGRCRPY